MKSEPILERSYTVARFWRCALQVNPSSYQSKYRGAEHGLDEASVVLHSVWNLSGCWRE